jgi:Mce-associated membrane protein
MPTRLTSEVDDPSVTEIDTVTPSGSTTARSDRAGTRVSGAEGDAIELDNAGTQSSGVATAISPASHVWLAMLVGILVAVVLAGLVGWLSYRFQVSHRDAERRDLFIQVGKQGALNLTTIDYREADSDIKRILDGATGQFHDEFAQRSQPFVSVVKQAKSKSVGTITEAGLESQTPDAAQVLVAVSVKTSTADGAEQDPRAWRMRISVQKVGDQAKVSNVRFVP